MNAKESVQNYPSRLREYANFSVRGTKKLCKAVGPRESGSEAEMKAQEEFRREIDTCCDSSVMEDYTLHPHALLGWISLDSVLLIISAVLYFFGFCVVSLVLTTLSFLFVIFEFILYRRFTDFMYGKKTSHNVYGVRKAAGKTERRIVFCGHADSAYEFTYIYHGGKKALTAIVVLTILGFIAYFIGTIAAVANGYVFNTPVEGTFLTVMRWVMLAWTPLFIVTFFFINFKRVVPGANDNMSGCFASIAVAKFMQDNDIRFENTEVGVLITGGEEAGLRGATAFMKAHEKELSDVDTVFIAIDTLRDFDFMAINEKDLHGLIKTDPRACKLVKKASDIAGYEAAFGSISLGATDALAFVRAGFPSVSFSAMDPTPARYYHTRLDTEDNMDIKAVEAGVNIALETAFLFDEQGLKSEY